MKSESSLRAGKILSGSFLKLVEKAYKQEMLAYYYNKAGEQNQEVVMTYIVNGISLVTMRR